MEFARLREILSGRPSFEDWCSVLQFLIVYDNHEACSYEEILKYVIDNTSHLGPEYRRFSLHHNFIGSSTVFIIDPLSDSAFKLGPPSSQRVINLLTLASSLKLNDTPISDETSQSIVQAIRRVHVEVRVVHDFSYQFIADLYQADKLIGIEISCGNPSLRKNIFPQPMTISKVSLRRYDRIEGSAGVSQIPVEWEYVTHLQCYNVSEEVIDWVLSETISLKHLEIYYDEDRHECYAPEKILEHNLENITGFSFGVGAMDSDSRQDEIFNSVKEVFQTRRIARVSFSEDTDEGRIGDLLFELFESDLISHLQEVYFCPDMDQDLLYHESRGEIVCEFVYLLLDLEIHLLSLSSRDYKKLERTLKRKNNTAALCGATMWLLV